MVYVDQTVPLLRCHCRLQRALPCKGACDAACTLHCIPCHYREKNPRKRVRHLRGTLASVLALASATCGSHPIADGHRVEMLHSPSHGRGVGAEQEHVAWLAQAASVLALLASHPQMALPGASGAACTLRETARELCAAGALDALVELLQRSSTALPTPDAAHLASLASECLLHLAQYLAHAEALLADPRCLPLVTHWLARGPWPVRVLAADLMTTVLSMAWRLPVTQGAALGEAGAMAALCAMARVTVDEVEAELDGPCGDLVASHMLRACHLEGTPLESSPNPEHRSRGPSGAPATAAPTARAQARPLVPAFALHVRKAGLTALTYMLSAAVAPTLADEDGTLDTDRSGRRMVTSRDGEHESWSTLAALEPLLVPALLLNLLSITVPGEAEGIIPEGGGTPAEVDALVCCMVLAARCLACLCAAPRGADERDALGGIRPMAAQHMAAPPPSPSPMAESLLMDDYVWVDPDECDDDSSRPPPFAAHMLLSLHESHTGGYGTTITTPDTAGVMSGKSALVAALPAALPDAMVPTLAVLEWSLLALRVLTGESSATEASTRLPTLLAAVTNSSATSSTLVRASLADLSPTGLEGSRGCLATGLSPAVSDTSSHNGGRNGTAATDALAQVAGAALIPRLSSSIIPALLEAGGLLGYCVGVLARRPAVAAAHRNLVAALPTLLAILSDSQTMSAGVTSTAAPISNPPCALPSANKNGGGITHQRTLLAEALEDMSVPLVAPFIEEQDTEDWEADGTGPRDTTGGMLLADHTAAANYDNNKSHHNSGACNSQTAPRRGRFPLVLSRAPPLVDSALLALVCFAAVVLPSQRSFLPASFGWQLHARVEHCRQTANGLVREGHLLRAVTGYTSALVNAQLLQRYTAVVSHPSSIAAGAPEEPVAGAGISTPDPCEPGAEELAVLWSNRAEAFLRCSWPAVALRDVCQALRLQPGHKKSLWRRDRALEACRVVGCATP